MIKTFEQFKKTSSLNEARINKSVILYDNNTSYLDVLTHLTIGCIKSTIEILREFGDRVELDSVYIDCGALWGRLEISAVEIVDDNDDLDGINMQGYHSIDESPFTNDDGEGILLTTSDGKKLFMDSGNGFPMSSYFDLNEELLEMLDDNFGRYTLA